MARNIKNNGVVCIGSFVTLLSFSVFLSISGFAISENTSKNFKLPIRFNLSALSLKEFSKENVTFATSEVENLKNSRGSTISNKANGVATKFKDVLQRPNGSLLAQVKLKKRTKRQTPSHNPTNDLFTWNFNLNVTRYGKKEQEANKDSSVSAEKLSGVAIYADGHEPRKAAFKDLHMAFKSVEAFLRNIFNADENRTNDLMEEQIHSFNESPWAKPNLTSLKSFNDGNTKIAIKSKIQENEVSHSFNKSEPSEQDPSKNTDLLELDDKSKNDSLPGKVREGRIFFGIFSFGGKSLSKTTPPVFNPETETAQDTDTGENIVTNESLLDVLSHKDVFVSDDFQQESSFHPDSLMSKTEHSVIDLNNENNTEELVLQIVSQQDDCFNCDNNGTEISNFRKSLDSSENVVSEATTRAAEHLLSDETWENLCMTLLSKSHESKPISNGRENAFDDRFESSQNLVIGNLSLSNTLEDKELKTDDAVIEDSFMVSSEESMTENTVLNGRQSRFFNMFGFGSGRSAIVDEESDLNFDRQADEQNNKLLPTVSDCKNYFEKEWKVKRILKPNHTFNLGNTSTSSTKESQLLENNSVQTTDKILLDKVDSGDNKILFGNENNLTVNQDSFSFNSVVKTESNDTSSNELITLGIIDSKTFQQTTEGQRDGRIFSFFNFGSGSSQGANITEQRRFFGFFSSGSRSLDTFDDANETDESDDFGSGEPFQEIPISGDGELSEDINENLSSTSVLERRFLGFLGFQGSGEGRELSESTDIITPQFSAHADDCNDYDYISESIRDPENIYNGTDIYPISHESDCQGDCNTSTEMLSTKENINSYLTSESIGFERKNLTEYFQSSLQNCSCSHKYNFTVGNDLSECDCNSSTMQKSNTTYLSSESAIYTDTLKTTNIMKTKLKDKEYDTECDDCNDEYISYEKHVTESVTTVETLKIKDLAVSPTKVVDKSGILFHQSTEVGDTSKPENITLILDYLNTTENSGIEQGTTEKKFRRFMGTIFFIGSGEGGLIGNDGGPINLVEEESIISPILNGPRRGGRLDDSLETQCDDCIEISDFLEGNLEMFPNQTSEFNGNSTIPSFNSHDGMSPTSRPTDAIVKVNNGETEEITFSSVTFSNNPLAFPNISKTPVQLQPRSCKGARDCNDTLNERCITINSSYICDCGRNFVRHKEKGKCVAKRLVGTSLKLPEEAFDEDLKNPDSTIYKEMREKSIETMWLLLNETRNILRIVTDVDVDGFTSGSLIISLNLVLAVDKESERETIKGMEDELQRALAEENVWKRASLNIRNASVLSITNELDPCKSTELNYCSKYADCISNEAFPGGFLCKCKEHYLDVSTNSFYSGEICEAKCPHKYCGSNGHCEILENEKMNCICYGLNFGERCEYPGMVILGSLSIIAFISLAVVCVALIKLRCSQWTRSYGRTPTFRRSEEILSHSIANGRVSDAIALGENRGMKVSKFTHISTPVIGPPVIKVTRPTLNESSISLDYDTSFDASELNEKTV